MPDEMGNIRSNGSDEVPAAGEAGASGWGGLEPSFDDEKEYVKELTGELEFSGSLAMGMEYDTPWSDEFKTQFSYCFSPQPQFGASAHAYYLGPALEPHPSPSVEVERSWQEVTEGLEKRKKRLAREKNERKYAKQRKREDARQRAQERLRLAEERWDEERWDETRRRNQENQELRAREAREREEARQRERRRLRAQARRYGWVILTFQRRLGPRVEIELCEVSQIGGVDLYVRLVCADLAVGGEALACSPRQHWDLLKCPDPKAMVRRTIESYGEQWGIEVAPPLEDE